MKGFNTYLMFDGNTRQAVTFYKDCLGAELHLMKYSEAPVPCPSAEASDRIMHAMLKKGDAILMASDTPPGTPSHQGNNFSININCESLPEIESLFTAFSEKGKVVTPLQDMFWGARFGMLTDQFGVNWMFNFEHPKQA